MSLLTGVAYNDLLAVTGSGPGDVFASQADWTAAANGAFGVGDMTLISRPSPGSVGYGCS